MIVSAGQPREQLAKNILLATDIFCKLRSSPLG